MAKTKEPKKLDDVFKDKALLKKFEAYCKKTHCSENIGFYQVKSWNAENLCRIYLGTKAKNEINLPSKLVKLIDELAGKKLWDDQRWDGIVKLSKKEVYKLLETDTFPKFMKAKAWE